VSEIHQELVDVLNRLAEAGTEVQSMTFSRSDVPVDWDDETQQWVMEASS